MTPTKSVYVTDSCLQKPGEQQRTLRSVQPRENRGVKVGVIRGSPGHRCYPCSSMGGRVCTIYSGLSPSAHVTYYFPAMVHRGMCCGRGVLVRFRLRQVCGIHLSPLTYSIEHVVPPMNKILWGIIMKPLLY